MTNNGNIFYAGSGFSGIVAPSTLYGLHEGGMYLSGPSGIVRLEGEGNEAMLNALESAGALIPGSQSATKAVNELLEDPRTSRTVSYLLCAAHSCEDLLEDMARLKKSRVLVFGCGGIGSTKSVILAGSGIEHLTITDGDIIEESNLNRQLFWRRSDIGQHKAKVLRDVLLEKFPTMTVNTVLKNLGLTDIEERISEGYDAIVVSADEPATLASNCKKLADKYKIPVVSGGYLHRMCMTNFYDGGMQKPFEPLIPNEDNLSYGQFEWKRLPGGIMPSFGPSNFALASMLASSVVAVLARKTLAPPKQHSIIWDANKLPLSFNTIIG